MLRDAGLHTVVAFFDEDTHAPNPQDIATLVDGRLFIAPPEELFTSTVTSRGLLHR
ncbi:hypothetical protein [Auraticoccus monumenti]|uniref:hypothetical protein n=1 Tax=Auraticoccus monumenti TaxID=675864 RepID=UPI0012F7A7FB|nr:hypothetical protein [Auraticoccus monumenti]